MKKKSTILIIVIILAALIIGASIAYNKLIADHSAQNLVGSGETVDNDAVSDKQSGASVSDTNTEAGNDAEANTTPESDSNTESASVTIDFTVEDWNGASINLSDFQGKPVVLNFWASWCGPCRAEMPDFDEMYQTYKDEIYFVMVNVTDGSRETVDTAKSFIQDTGYSFPVYFDTALSASYTFGASSLPSSFFIDADGNVIAKAVGTINKDIMQQGIDMIYQPE